MAQVGVHQEAVAPVGAQALAPLALAAGAGAADQAVAVGPAVRGKHLFDLWLTTI